MQRHENESFDAYKARRAIANLETKNFERYTKGGNSTSREMQRRDCDNSKHAGQYGKSLIAHFATLRATPALLAKHKQHLQADAARKATRAANSAAMLAAA